MSRTQKFVKVSKKDIKRSPVLSKTTRIDSVAKTKIKMIATHNHRSR
ncbi:MAG: hypothetical protein MJ156_02205 [Alphaproteobacteria bacterium]|nr:hypothetical protein [Alphaproteobacteria bacterium]